VIATRTVHLQTYGLKLNVVALVDSSGAVSDASGLTDAELSAAIVAKESGGAMKAQAKGSDVSLSALVNQAWRDPLIVVDCSATDATVGCASGGVARPIGRKAHAHAPFITDDSDLRTGR
jgi:hypothetical protein